MIKDSKSTLGANLGPLKVGGAPPPSPRLLKQKQAVVAQGISQIATEPIEWPWRYRSQAPSRARCAKR